MSRLPLRAPILSPAAAGLTIVAGLAPARAWAHVKWFEPYDVTRSPIPIRGIVKVHFVLVLAGFTLLILYAMVCGSLMWAAIEKWAYPQWTYPLLEARPYLTLGIPAGDFMVVAGFVEFALAFYILTGLGLIFVSAILDFGKLDAIGYLPTIACLAGQRPRTPGCDGSGRSGDAGRPAA